MVAACLTLHSAGAKFPRQHPIYAGVASSTYPLLVQEVQTELSSIKKATKKRQDIGKALGPEILADTEAVIKLFAANLPSVLVHRHEDSRWNGERLFELQPLFNTPSDTLVSGWKATNIAALKKAHKKRGDEQQHSAAFREKHPDQPEALDAGNCFPSARMPRVCSDLPFLAKLATSEHPVSTSDKFSWTNAGVEAGRGDSDGLFKPGCFLDIHYDSIFSSSPKLRAMATILRKHKKKPVVILGSFLGRRASNQPNRRRTSKQRRMERTGSTSLREHMSGTWVNFERLPMAN